MTAYINSNLGANIATGQVFLNATVALDIHLSLDNYTVASGGNALNDIILFKGAVIGSGDVIDNIFVANTALDTNATPTLAFKLGLYAVDRVSGVVTIPVSGADTLFVSSASTQLQAAADYTTQLNIAGNFAAAAKLKRVWEILNLAADPNVTYVVGMHITAVAATAAAGTIALKVGRLIKGE